MILFSPLQNTADILASCKKTNVRCNLGLPSPIEIEHDIEIENDFFETVLISFRQIKQMCYLIARIVLNGCCLNAWPYSRYLHVKTGTESWIGLTEKVGSGNKSERISDQLTTRGHVLSHRGRKTPFKVNTKTRKIFFT